MSVLAVVMFSSGGGSWAAGRRWIDQHGPTGVTLLFADVKGQCPSRHAGEDDDNYRFLIEAACDLYDVPERPTAPPARLIEAATVAVDAYGESDDRDADIASFAAWLNYREFAATHLPQLVWIVGNEHIWQVYRRRRRIGSSYAANCSEELKQKVAKRWLKEHAHVNTEIIIGIDWSETRRIPAVEGAYYPRPVRFPMCEPPYMDKDQVIAHLRERGIEPPRLYGALYSHANCGGFCVRAGKAHTAHLLDENRARFLYHEREEEKTRVFLGKDIAIYTETRASQKVPLTLRAFREQVESQTALFDPDDFGGCGCFVDEPPSALPQQPAVNDGAAA